MKLIILILCLIVGLVIYKYLYSPKRSILELCKVYEEEYKQGLMRFLEIGRQIYEVCGITEDLMIEASLKIKSGYVNTHRYSLYVPHVPQKNKVIDLINPPCEFQTILKRLPLKDFIYGVDLTLDCGRIYINELIQEDHVTAYEWIQDKLATKRYKKISHLSLQKILKEEFADTYDDFINILPITLWDNTYSKVDSREGSKPCSFYISPEHHPSLGSLRTKLELFYRKIYGKKSDDIERWFDIYRNSSITWFVLTKKDKIEFSLYLNSNGSFVDKLENKMFDMCIRDASKLHL